MKIRFSVSAARLLSLMLIASPLAAAPATSVSRIPAANGYGAVLLDLGQARLTHFREHPYASEEPHAERPTAS